MRFFKRKKTPPRPPSIELGINELREEVRIKLTEPTNIAIAGMTRSGKSSLLYSILYQLSCLDNTQIYCLDLTNIVASVLTHSPVLKASARDTDSPESYIRILDEILAEVKRRTQYLSENGLDKITHASVEYPRIVLVIEELPSLMDWLSGEDSLKKTADKVSKKFISKLRTILATALKTNVFVIMLAQRMDSALLGSGAARANIGVKICLRSDKDGLLMMFPQADEITVRRILSAQPGIAVATYPGENGYETGFMRCRYKTYQELQTVYGVR